MVASHNLTPSCRPWSKGGFLSRTAVTGKFKGAPTWLWSWNLGIPVSSKQKPAAESFVIAYEPVWAIGTGRTASPEQAQEACRHIKEHLATGLAVTGVRVLYGGSVTADNAAVLFAEADIDGALVGGASLSSDTFAAIVGAAAMSSPPAR